MEVVCVKPKSVSPKMVKEDTPTLSHWLRQRKGENIKGTLSSVLGISLVRMNLYNAADRGIEFRSVVASASGLCGG
jgi:hypothetical protein